jgi:hypothetical protein
MTEFTSRSEMPESPIPTLSDNCVWEYDVNGDRICVQHPNDIFFENGRWWCFYDSISLPCDLKDNTPKLLCERTLEEQKEYIRNCFQNPPEGEKPMQFSEFEIITIFQKPGNCSNVQQLLDYCKIIYKEN